MDECRNTPRTIPLRGGLNFRDLGGYPAWTGRVQRGLLFRAGSTHALDDEDRARVLALGIRTAFDLRSATERSRFPHALMTAPDVEYLAHDHERVTGNILHMLQDQAVDGGMVRSHMISLYRALPYEFAKAYQALFEKAAFGALPLMFSCAAGKDRTGVAAALLLSALGVARKDITDDYLLTSEQLPSILAMYRKTSLRDRLDDSRSSIWGPVLAADEQYLNAMFDEVLDGNGSVEPYLRDVLGIEPAVISRLRSRLLVKE